VHLDPWIVVDMTKEIDRVGPSSAVDLRRCLLSGFVPAPYYLIPLVCEIPSPSVLIFFNMPCNGLAGSAGTGERETAGVRVGRGEVRPWDWTISRVKTGLPGTYSNGLAPTPA
jgi:hypothetical protein